MRSHSSPFPRAATVSQARPGRERHVRGDARAQRARVVRALEYREIAPRAHVMHARDAALGDVRHRRVERAEIHLHARLGDRAGHEILRVVLEDARRLAGSIADDRSAGDVLRCARDLRGGERQRVREVHVSVEPIDPHRIVRRDGVDPVAAGQLAAPVLMIPVAVQDPRPRRDGCRRTP